MIAWALGVALLILALAYAGACVYLYRAQLRLLYPGDGLAFGPFEALSAIGGQAVETERGGQSLRYYHVPAQGTAAKAWVVLFHGNRHGARERFDFAERLSGMGCSVVLAEFPGYAGDPVGATQQSLLRNGLAMVDQVKALAQGLPVFYFGESLGTAIATYAAIRRNPKGLLLSTPYTSLAAVAKFRYPLLPVLRLIKYPMPAERWAAHVRCPVFVVHGTHDHVVPYQLGVAQAAKFQTPPRFVAIDGLGHSDIRDRYPELYWGGVQKFIEDNLSA